MPTVKPVRASETFVPQPLSTREARHFATSWLADHDLARFVPRVTLAVSELAANAVMHTARPFTVAVVETEAGVRIEVVDSAPHLVPMRIPRHGTAVDLIALSETGRGLQIVSAVANRWGVLLSQNVKTVWCEFDVSAPSAPSDPAIVDDRPVAPRDADVLHFHYVGLPVRAAIASGLELEEAIRTVRSEGLRTPSAETLKLLELVDRTASLRLAGRHAAFYASSQDQLSFDLDVETTDEEMTATAMLNGALAARGRRGPSAEVRHFREWLVEETLHQRAGDAPTPYAEAAQPGHAEWLWDQAGAGYVVLELDGSVLRMNATLREWVGDAPPREFVAEVNERLRSRGHVNDLTVRLRHRDGSAMDARVSATVEHDPDNKPIAVHVVVHPPQSQDTGELVRALQQTLIPATPPNVPGLDVAAAYHPASGEVGGDFYDVFEVSEGDWCAVLGDVSGKGVEAAIVTSAARHAIRSSALREPVPSGLMTALNRALIDTGSSRFCTVALLRVQESNGGWVAHLTSGGHPYPLLVRHGMVTRLGSAGSLLGMFDDVKFHDVSIKLAVGDALVLYTDGVTEARNGAGEFFGEARMHQAIAEAGSSAQAIVDAVLHRVLEFQEGRADDIALVVVRRPSL